MSVDGTLTAIDGALEDWGTSKDAMRWQPEPERVICDGGRPLMPLRYARDSDLVSALLAPGAVFITQSFRVDLGPFIEQMNQLGRMITRTLVPAFHAAIEPLREKAHEVDAVFYPRLHIRCYRCNPAGNPKPLAVSGVAYRRRQQARKRHR